MFMCERCVKLGPVPVEHESDGVGKKSQCEPCKNNTNNGYTCDYAACEALMLTPYIEVTSDSVEQPAVFCNEECYRQAHEQKHPHHPIPNMLPFTTVVPCTEHAYTNPTLVVSPSGIEVELVWLWKGSARPAGMVPREIFELLATLYLALPRVQELEIYKTGVSMRFKNPIIGDSRLPEHVEATGSLWEEGGVLEADRKRKRDLIGDVEMVEDCMFHNFNLVEHILGVIKSPQVYEYDNWAPTFKAKVEKVDQLFFKGDRRDDDTMCHGFKSTFMPGTVFKIATVMGIVDGHNPSTMQPNLAKHRADARGLIIQTFMTWLKCNHMEFLRDSVHHGQSTGM